MRDPTTKSTGKNKPRIPSKAREEILGILADDMKITTDQIDAILARHGVRRNAAVLQRRYRLAEGQKLLADIRDADGRREVLAVRYGTGATEYVVVDCCNDPQKLRAIRRRLHGQIAGLENTSGKVKLRIGWLEKILGTIYRKEGKHHDR